MCVCVCVSERENNRGKERERERDRETKRETKRERKKRTRVCVCVVKSLNSWYLDVLAEIYSTCGKMRCTAQHLIFRTFVLYISSFHMYYSDNSLVSWYLDVLFYRALLQRDP